MRRKFISVSHSECTVIDPILGKRRFWAPWNGGYIREGDRQLFDSRGNALVYGGEQSRSVTDIVRAWTKSRTLP